MTFKAILLSISLLFIARLCGQTRTITGKVIGEALYPVYEARIFNADNLLLVTTDTSGNFKLEIPIETKSIIISSLGMERKNIDLTGNCSNLDIILLSSATYDFMSAGKVDRLRKKDFDKLPALHQAAFEKGIFKLVKPCYTEKFIPIKKRLKEIHKNRIQTPNP